MVLGLLILALYQFSTESFRYRITTFYLEEDLQCAIEKIRTSTERIQDRKEQANKRLNQTQLET
jgi:hypothetical protein